MTLNVINQYSDPTQEVTHHPVNLAGASPFVRYNPATEGQPWRVGTIANGTYGQRWVFVGPAATDLVTTATLASPLALAVSSTTFVPSAGTGYTAYAPILTGQYGWVAELGV
jgi:hypothetical protein